MLRGTKKRILAAVLALSVFCAFDGTSDAAAKASKKAAVKPKEMKLSVGGKKTIKIVRKKPGAKYTFKATNKKISVNKNGKVTAKKTGRSSVVVKEVYKKKSKKIATVKVKISKAKTTSKPKDTSKPKVSTAPSVKPAEPTAPATTMPAASPEASATPAKSTKPTYIPTEEEYNKMVSDSFVSTGNNARVKSVMERAKAGEDVTLAYIGGSITEGAGAKTNNLCYAQTSAEAFAAKYGKDGGKNVHFINAGMSGTTSALGAIRYERDVIDRNGGKSPDMLFIEFAVNDNDDRKEAGGTDGGAYEGLIRRALASDAAVVLIFSVFKKVSGARVRESFLMPFGEYYDLPMISMGNATNIEVNDETPGFNNWYFKSDGLHPTTEGHKLMCDCIMNLMSKIEAEEKKTDNIDSKNLPAPKKTDAYQNVKLLTAGTDIAATEGVSDLVVGGFGQTDTSMPTLAYEYKGEQNAKIFPDNWMHEGTGSDADFTVKIHCRALMFARKKFQAAGTAGSVNIFVDGKKIKLYTDDEETEILTGTGNGAWNNAWVNLIFEEEEAKDHTLKISVRDPGNFTLFGIGYSK